MSRPVAPARRARSDRYSKSRGVVIPAGVRGLEGVRAEIQGVIEVGLLQTDPVEHLESLGESALPNERLGEAALDLRAAIRERDRLLG